MPGEGLEPTIPAFERAKTVRALDREATVISELKEHGGPKLAEYKVRVHLLLHVQSCLASYEPLSM
jgi:hypothetical protein